MQWEGMLRVALSESSPLFPQERSKILGCELAQTIEKDLFQIQRNNFHKNPQTGEAVNCSKQADGSKSRSRLLLDPCNRTNMSAITIGGFLNLKAVTLAQQCCATMP
jgi:hypothetical protein